MGQAADRLGISTTAVMIARKLIPAMQVVPCAPWEIGPETLELPAVRAAVETIKRGQHVPPDQASAADDDSLPARIRFDRLIHLHHGDGSVVHRSARAATGLAKRWPADGGLVAGEIPIGSSQRNYTPGKLFAPPFRDLLINRLGVQLYNHVLVVVMNSAQLIRPLLIRNNYSGFGGSECQFIAEYSPLAFPGPIDDLLSNWLEPNVAPTEVFWQKMKIAVWLIDYRSTAALINPVLFEHQSELGISGERELANKSGSKGGDRRFREGDTPIATADHSVASNESAFANDRSQSGECIVHALTPTTREVNQLIADIEAPGHCDP
jgi:hypothetical protein